MVFEQFFLLTLTNVSFCCKGMRVCWLASAGFCLHMALSFSGHFKLWERSLLRLTWVTRASGSQKKISLWLQCTHCKPVTTGGKNQLTCWINSAGKAERCSEFILIPHRTEESLRMKTNPVKIYFTPYSFLIWISSFTAPLQQEDPSCWRVSWCAVCLLLLSNGNHEVVFSTWEMALKWFV